MQGVNQEDMFYIPDHMLRDRLLRGRLRDYT